MEAKEVVIAVVVPSAIGVLPWLLERRGVSVPTRVITLGGVLTIAAICLGLFHFIRWVFDNYSWMSEGTSKLSSALVAAIIATAFITLWIAKPEHATTVPPKQAAEPTKPPEAKPTDQPPPAAKPILGAKVSPQKTPISKSGTTGTSGPPAISTGPITTGDCSNVQIGGNGNQATVNCGPVERERHLSQQQINQLKDAINSAPEGQQVSFCNLPLKASSNFDWEVYRMLAGSIDGNRLKDVHGRKPKGLVPIISWGGPTPTGIKLFIHDPNAEITAGKLRDIFSQIDDSRIQIYPEIVESGEIRICAGEVSRNPTVDKH